MLCQERESQQSRGDKKKREKESGGATIGLRAEMEALRREFDLTDSQRTPVAGEALRAFYR